MNLFFQVFVLLNVMAIVFFLYLYYERSKEKVKSYRVRVHHDISGEYFYHDLVASSEREAYSMTKALYPNNRLGNVYELPEGTFNFGRN